MLWDMQWLCILFTSIGQAVPCNLHMLATHNWITFNGYIIKNGSKVASLNEKNGKKLSYWKFFVCEINARKKMAFRKVSVCGKWNKNIFAIVIIDHGNYHKFIHFNQKKAMCMPIIKLFMKIKQYSNPFKYLNDAAF